MRLPWLFRRLRAMTVAEALWRIAIAVRHGVLMLTRRWVRARPRSAPERAFGLEAVAGMPLALTEAAAEAKEPIVASALDWLEHRGSFLNLDRIPLGEEVDWHRDYSSGRVAPRRYCALIDHRDVRSVGDVKYIWELNRLHHLVLLALAGRWAGDARFAEEIASQCRSWRAQNPFMAGLNWKSPLEAGIRLISWAWVAQLSTEDERATLFDRELLETVYQHQRFVRSFHSRYSSANNHLIGEMAGLYVASIAWPWFEESDRWRSFARERLIEAICDQVEPDGVLRERATGYQLFTMEFFLLAAALGQAVEDPFPESYWERLRSMSRFLSAARETGVALPAWGDGDDGQVAVPRLPAHMRAAALAEAIEGVENDSTPVEARVWASLLLWGQRQSALPQAGRSRSGSRHPISFPDGGYVFLSSGHESDRLAVAFDAGPLGLDPLFAHAHADALSVCVSYGGREFLIDPGTYSYYSQADWRDYFRGTAAHNTVRIDSTDQSVISGRFLWREPAGCRLERCVDVGPSVECEARHDGYTRLADPVSHRRLLSLDKGGRSLRITDRLDCQARHDVELCFHFAARCRVERLAERLYEVRNSDKRLEIRLDHRVEGTLYRGSEEPRFGWWSPAFGVKEPTFTLVGRAVLEDSTGLVTEIVAR